MFKRFEFQSIVNTTEMTMGIVHRLLVLPPKRELFHQEFSSWITYNHGYVDSSTLDGIAH